MRDWEEAPAHAGELAALYSAYHRRLERLGAVDAEGLARAALDALRERPAAWGGRPVFLYGFDDLTPLQRDAVETLARHAEVCVALAYEPGRAAFAGRAATVELLKPLAERHELLEDRSEHYARRTRATRCTTSSAACSSRTPAGVPPNGAVRLLEAGGERAEAELVAAEVLELMRDPASLPRTSPCSCAAARPRPACSARCSRATASRSSLERRIAARPHAARCRRAGRRPRRAARAARRRTC